MGKTTLKNTDFLGKREKITSKAVKITDFYYLCTVMLSKAKQCKAIRLSIMNISLRSMKEKNSIRTKLRRLGFSLLKRESNYLDRQRQWLLVCFAVMLSLGILSNILGVSGAFDPFFTASNIVFLVVVVSSFAAYLLGKIGVVKGITFLAVATQVFIGMDILYSAFVPTLKDNTMVILINMLILAGNMFFSLAAYQARLTRWLVGIALGVYLVCVIVTGNESLRNYFFMMLLILLFISVLSLGIARNGEYLVNANKILQREEEELLQVLRINKKQIKAYVALAKERHDVKLTEHLLDLLGEASQKNVIDNVLQYIQTRELSKQNLERVFPELSSSEREICYLILQNKKLSEIGILLNKTESNITTQRGNIRKKLGMNPSDNLQKVLEKRIRE
jgi:hypothetical protein